MFKKIGDFFKRVWENRKPYIVAMVSGLISLAERPIADYIEKNKDKIEPDKWAKDITDIFRKLLKQL